MGSQKQRVVVTGCAGLIGSHFVEALIDRGDEVIGVDNFLTGQPQNLDAVKDAPGFSLIEADVCSPGVLDQISDFDAICHLASPASPTDFVTKAPDILRVGSIGTMACIDAAQRVGARMLLASTSEVYGDPLVHPQQETYYGNVNSVGPRACYDESKRFAEAAVSTHVRSFGLNAGIVRIFNTYGPRMRADDGRVVSNFVVQALQGKSLTIQGDGSQTRSFCYVTDQVAGMIALLDSDEQGPINIGNPGEFTILELAELVNEMLGSTQEFTYLPLPADDPMQRKPDITRASERLGWAPTVSLREGLPNVIAYFAKELGVQQP